LSPRNVRQPAGAGAGAIQVGGSAGERSAEIQQRMARISRIGVKNMDQDASDDVDVSSKQGLEDPI